MSSLSRRNFTAPLFLVFLMVTMSWSSAIDNRLDAQQDSTSLSDIVVAHVGWSSPTTLDNTIDVGMYSSLAIDSNDNLHMAYYDDWNGSLEYMTYNDSTSSWSTPVSLDSTDRVGKNPSLAIDSNDNLHVTYLDVTNYNLEYMTYDASASSWSTPLTLDSTDVVGLESSLAIDSYDNLHVTYWDSTNGNLEYMTYDGSSWSTPVSLDSTDDVGRASSLAIDSDDDLHVTYFDYTNKNLEYMAYNGSSWSTPVSLDSTYDVGWTSSLAIDSNDNLHVTYVTDGQWDNNDLEYMFFDNTLSSWTAPLTLDSTDAVGGQSSLAIDSNENLHVTYYDWTNLNLEYMAFNGSSWSTPVTLDSTDDVGKWSSLAIDSNDNLHVTYYDGTNKNLEYMMYEAAVPPNISYSPSDLNLTNNSAMATYSPTNTGGPIGAFSTVSGFLNSTLETTGAVGDHNSMTIDANGNFHIAYYHSTSTQNLKYGTDKSGSWVYTTLDSTGDVGMHTSIAIDSNSAVHISYYDETNSALKYATDKSGSWVYSTLDSTGDVGMHTSIAIDSNDAVHISYYDVNNEDLKYASDQSSSWVITTLESTGDVGKYTSIALDSNDDVHISYNDVTNRYLKYATDKGGPWVLTDIDSSWNVGRDTSIAIDSSDKIHISYLDYATFDLKYATDKGGSWVTSTIDSTGQVGWYTSIVLDSNDVVHISYYDDTGSMLGKLKYITDKSGSWVALTLAFSPGEEIGRDNAIVIDSNDEVHILYHDWTNQNLMYAQSTSTVVSGFSITPSLSNGLDFNTTTGNISGTPLALFNRTMYTITATNADGSSTVFVNITVNGVVPVITYSPENRTVTNNSIMEVLSPTNTGGAITSWSILPLFSHGLNFDDSNGQIYGTPTALLATTMYTITATNIGGSATANVNITVNDIVPVISYSPENRTVTNNSIMETLSPTNTGGAITSWSILPLFSHGLDFDDSNGQIYGTPTALLATTMYTITATNTGGSATANVNITVLLEIQAPLVSYSPEDVSLTRGIDMAVLSPVIDGGAVLTWSILPELPNGLSFGETNGSVWGASLVNMTRTLYTVQATNSAGTGSTTFNLTVNEPWILAATYSLENITLTRSITMMPLAPELSGGVVTSWGIEPMQPAGLSFENGILSGTPIINMTQTTFTIWANNSGGSSTSTLNITIFEPGPIVFYSSENLTLIRGEAMITSEPVLGVGLVENWSITDSLPDGLLFEGGSISGTPLFNSTIISYTVRAENTGGLVLVLINITVVEPASVLSIDPTKFSITRDNTSMAVQVNNSGGMVEQWQILPSLPAGLTMENGFVSGIATVNQSEIIYTIWGNNSGGSDSVSFTLTIYNPDVKVVTPSPNSTPLNLLFLLCGALIVIIFLLTFFGVFSKKRVEEQKLALVPGQEEENLRLAKNSESDIETDETVESSQNDTMGTSTGTDTEDSFSETLLVATTSIDAAVEDSPQAAATETSTEEKILHLPTVVEITEAITGKMIVDLPDEVDSSQMLTAKKVVDLSGKLQTPELPEIPTGKMIVDLPDEVDSSQMLTGKKIVDLSGKPQTPELPEIPTGKMIVNLPDEVDSSQMLTGKKLDKFPSEHDLTKADKKE